MGYFAEVEMPGGIVYVEVEDLDQQTRPAGIRNKLPSYTDIVSQVVDSTQVLIEQMKTLAPDEVELNVGIKLTAEVGTPFWGIAKSGGDANFAIKLKWNKNK